jgi:isopenicillin N synthase-like dioxygenase
MSTNFTSVPVLDYALLSSASTRHDFITQLRHALIDVGFLYLQNPPVEPELVSRLKATIPPLFDDLSQDDKDAIAMANSPHFLGYSRLGTEQTKAKTDMREQYDFATEFECRWKEGDPEYMKLWGRSQVGLLELDIFLAHCLFRGAFCAVASRRQASRLPRHNGTIPKGC